MHDRSFVGDDRGLPPVVGVILMVGITVVLAATVTAFVLGFTGLLQAPPQAGFGFDYDPGGSGDCDLADGPDHDGVLTISHESGNAIDADRLTVKTASGETAWSDCGGTADVVNASAEVRVSVDETQEVRVIWTSTDGERTQTLGKWDGAEN